MPSSENSRRAWAATSFSWNRPTVVKKGVRCVAESAGLAVCAATQIEQEAASVWLGCWWVDSAAAVHSRRDRQNQAGHRNHERIIVPLRD